MMADRQASVLSGLRLCMSYNSTQLLVVVLTHGCNRGWQGLFSEGFGDGEKEKPKRVVNRMPAGGKRTDIVVKTEAVEHSGGRFGGKVSCKSFHRIRYYSMPDDYSG
jgi:hypothetical protein